VNVQTLLDKALDQGDLVPPGSQDYIDRRRLALAFLTEVFEDAYWRRDWPFKRQGPTAVTVLPGESRVAAPLDFQSIGTYGGLYDSDGNKLLEVPESVIFDQREEDDRTDNPRIFSIFGQDPLTFKVYLQFPPNDAAGTYSLWYQPRPPRLLDAGDPDFIDTYFAIAGGGVTRNGTTVMFLTTAPHSFASGDRVVIAEAIEDYNGSYLVTVYTPTQFTYETVETPTSPATTATAISAELDLATGNLALNTIDPQYHTVLLNGVKAKLRESKGDARWQFLQGEYEKGVAAMLREEQRMQSDGMKQIPSFFGSMGRSRY
jgi:hypothetical protein